MLPVFFHPKKLSTYFYYFFLPVLAIVLPVVFVLFELPIMPRITMARQQLFELFGFFMWAVLAINAYREIRIHPGLTFKKAVVILLPLLVSFWFLVMISEWYSPSWDYEQYENAFRSIVEGNNPYESTRYLYPPAFAQAMASVHTLGTWLFPNGGINLWLFVYYIHQCLQFLLLNLAYWLACRFAFRVGLPHLEGVLLVSGLFLFNYPLFRTLQLNQVNLYVLNAILIATLALRRFPYLSGLAVTLGGMIKIYPFALGAPLLGMKKWRAILGMLIGAGLVILIQTSFLENVSLWKQFVRFYLSFPVERESSLWFRNSSTLSFVRNVVHFSHVSESAILPLFILVATAMLAWMTVRFFQREKSFQGQRPGAVADTYRDFGQLLDFSVLTLLIAPSAWDHHFVVTIPLAIWAIALQSRNKPGWVGVAVASIFVLPGFNVFPLSYVRLVGVILLLWLTPPSVCFDPAEIRAAARAWRDGRGADGGRSPS